jgi:hypothetical protein
VRLGSGRVMVSLCEQIANTWPERCFPRQAGLKPAGTVDEAVNKSPLRG